jgi:hypothetical protein
MYARLVHAAQKLKCGPLVFFAYLKIMHSLQLFLHWKCDLILWVSAHMH